MNQQLRITVYIFHRHFTYLDVQLTMILLFLLFLQSRTRIGTRHLRVNENFPPEVKSVQSMGHINEQTKDSTCRMSHYTKQLQTRADSGSPAGEKFTSCGLVHRYQRFEEHWCSCTKQNSFTYNTK